jgi:hypothetical protein
MFAVDVVKVFWRYKCKFSILLSAKFMDQMYHSINTFILSYDCMVVKMQTQLHYKALRCIFYTVVALKYLNYNMLVSMMLNVQDYGNGNHDVFRVVPRY